MIEKDVGVDSIRQSPIEQPLSEINVFHPFIHE